MSLHEIEIVETRTTGSSRLTKPVGLFSLAFVLLFAQLGQAQSLNYFRNFFVTGDYAVGGVGMEALGVDGLATGEIHFDLAHMNEVPASAEILAAYLYWQVVVNVNNGEESGAAGTMFNGFPLNSPEGFPFWVGLSPGGTAPCWGSGGGTGASSGSKGTFTFRSDVLHFLPISTTTGQRLVNDADLASEGLPPLSVVLPDAGSSGNAVPNALGASLVVIYGTRTRTRRCMRSSSMTAATR